MSSIFSRIYWPFVHLPCGPTWPKQFALPSFFPFAQWCLSQPTGKDQDSSLSKIRLQSHIQQIFIKRHISHGDKHQKHRPEKGTAVPSFQLVQQNKHKKDCYQKQTNKNPASRTTVEVT